MEISMRGRRRQRTKIPRPEAHGDYASRPVGGARFGGDEVDGTHSDEDVSALFESDERKCCSLSTNARSVFVVAGRRKFAAPDVRPSYLKLADCESVPG